MSFLDLHWFIGCRIFPPNWDFPAMHVYVPNWQIFSCLASPMVGISFSTLLSLGAWVLSRPGVTFFILGVLNWRMWKGEAKLHWVGGGGGAQRSDLRINEPKKTLAFSEQRQYFACIYFTVGSDKIWKIVKLFVYIVDFFLYRHQFVCMCKYADLEYGGGGGWGGAGLRNI